MIIRLGHKSVNIDLLAFEAAKERLTSKLTRRGVVVFKPEPLAVLAVQFGLSTVSEAWQLWLAVDTLAEEAAKEHAIRAEVGYWYNLDPFALSETEVLSLRGNLPKLQAQQKISRGDYDALDYEGIYRLFLTAFDDEDLARKKQTESFRLFVEKSTKSATASRR